MIFRHKLCHPKEKKHWLDLACLPKIKSNKYPLRFTFLLLQSNLQGSRVQIYEGTSEFSFFGPHGFSVTVSVLQIRNKKFSCLQRHETKLWVKAVNAWVRSASGNVSSCSLSNMDSRHNKVKRLWNTIVHCPLYHHQAPVSITTCSSRS